LSLSLGTVNEVPTGNFAKVLQQLLQQLPFRVYAKAPEVFLGLAVRKDIEQAQEVLLWCQRM
jgi:hypothetical protein